LLIIGLALTLFGALILSWRDIRGSRKPPTWNDFADPHFLGNVLARPGFVLIALGSALQIAGVAIS
jgi:hypothetical protein